VVRSIASHLPSNPVRSCNAISEFPLLIRTVPPSCQCHDFPSVPKVVSRAELLMRSLNFPGAPGTSQGATQSRVLTHTRYFPFAGIVIVVRASFTGTPRPCASKYDDPMISIDCWSTTHPPGSEKLSASIKTSPDGLSQDENPEIIIISVRILFKNFIIILFLFTG